ncbi:hypothetical protein OROGR_002352 [Orobanche gracilis]
MVQLGSLDSFLSELERAFLLGKVIELSWVRLDRSLSRARGSLGSSNRPCCNRLLPGKSTRYDIVRMRREQAASE